MRARAAVALLLALAPLSALADDEVPAEAEANGGEGYAPTAEAEHETLRFTGYLDVGFAVAQGNGSSHAEGDTRVPADYGSDFFAPAVNSRGEVASTDAEGYFQNGFLPRSVGRFQRRVLVGESDCFLDAFFEFVNALFQRFNGTVFSWLLGFNRNAL